MSSTWKFLNKCPSGNKEAYYTEFYEEEEMLLMSYMGLYKARREDTWFFFYSRCSNHIYGDRTMFNELNEKFQHSVKLENNTKMDVMGK